MRDQKALITIAICTYNRHEHLKKLLPPLLSGQTLSQELYKVIVVDNSDDATARKAFAKHFQREQNLLIIESQPPGLSRARNKALEACTTPYLVYLDDDASPNPEWLNAVLRAFTTHDPAVVAGPIYPAWPGAQPDWLPRKYVACLAILDHGLKDRWLSENEFAYGANMAFKADALRELGGFNVGLGRKGGQSLLSEEELEAQLALRRRGHRAFYAAAAGVVHTVHSDRLTRNYFRARMTWQAVSVLLREPPLKHFDWSQRELRAAANMLGLGELLSKLMTYQDADTFSAQLDIIYHLFAILLESKDLDDLTVEGALANGSSATAATKLRLLTGSPGSHHASAPILPSTRHLIVEGQPEHFFLYALYGELADSQLLLFPDPMWHNFDEPLAYIQRSITPTLRTLTFVTLEPLIYGGSRRAFNRLIGASGVACFGILHRLPENPEQADALREVAPRMAGIMVLAQELGERLRREFQLCNVSYLPLHPPYVKYLMRDPGRIRSKIGASETQAVFSILGQVRKGKGIDLVLEALDHVASGDVQDMFFLIAGRAQDVDRNMISRTFSAKKAHHYIDLGSSKNPQKYAVLTEREFGEYVNASDIGIVLYQHDQRECMSGVAPNYIWGFKPLIAVQNSVIGRIVVDNELGIVAEKETPEAIAQALTSALRLHQQGWKPAPAFNKYRAEIAPEKVLNRLAEILGDKPRHESLSIKTSSESIITTSSETIIGKEDEHSREWPAGFAEYLSNLPLLHSWDGGLTWNTGGFQAEHLAALYRFLKENLPSSPTLLETGAGNSTISFLFLNPSRLVSIAPEPALFARIRSYCANNSISVAALDARVSGSEWILPQMALDMRDQPPCFDFALIDGCHNWPMVFVDFCYANYMLKTNGLIMIDDVNLQSIKELARMLSEQPDFRLELDLGKSLIFRRINDRRTLGEWTEIPYITRKTLEYAQGVNSFSLYPASKASITE
jgi:GT2 family glycosyltransferase/glycosyltransferase involved in cell wall biosynthesis